jgi:hypothetical protein
MYSWLLILERFKVCLSVCLSVCLVRLVWSGSSVPIEFPRTCISVNPRNYTYEFPRRCISVNSRKSAVFTYEFPRMCISVNRNTTMGADMRPP